VIQRITNTNKLKAVELSFLGMVAIIINTSPKDGGCYEEA